MTQIPPPIDRTRMHRLSCMLLLVAAIVAAGAVRAEAQALLLKNAVIIDPATETVTRGSIVIRDGKIDGVFPGSPAGFTSFEGTVVDLEGACVMPLLYDMHVHSFGNIGVGNMLDIFGTEKTARVMLYCGIGGFLDLFSVEDMILPLRDRQRSTGLVGADIYAAGPIITCPGGHGTEYGLPTRTISTPAEAVREVGALAAHHPDVVKIVYDHAATWMPTIDRATMQAAVRTASEHGLKTVVHIGTWNDAREAIEAGATCITHVSLDSVIPDDLVRLMREKHVYEIPTMAVESELANIAADPGLLDRPLLTQVAARTTLATYRDTTTYDRRSRTFMGWLRSGAANLRASVKKMQDGGVMLLAGTDVGNVGTFQGYSLHRELELMVGAGLTPWQALRSATSRAGEFLGRPVAIRAGAPADLLVLTASPVDDISATQRIVRVIQRGVMIDRAALLNPPVVPWTRALVDDFSSPTMHPGGASEWNLESDSSFGGTSSVSAVRTGGTMRVRGALAPGNGRPGIAGVTFQFDSAGAPFDVSAFDGVRLRIRVDKGTPTLKLLSAGIRNYDYHTGFLAVKPGMNTIDIPFASCRQLFSAQVPWTGLDMLGLAVWDVAMTPERYDFTIDSIELYSAKH